MEYLFLLALMLPVIAAIGHVLWLLGASILRFALGIAPDRTPERLPTRECVRCGGVQPARSNVCRICGLDASSEVAAELSDLAATLRQLRRLREADTIPTDALQLLTTAVQQRYGMLSERRGQQARPAASAPVLTPVPKPVPPELDESILTVLPADAPVVALPSPEPLPAFRLLANLLTSCPSVSDLSLAERDRALTWYHRSTAAELGSLSPRIQQLLGRLLKVCRLPDDALRTYVRLLAGHPDDVLMPEITLEAGRFFATEGANRAAAVQFLKFACDGLVNPQLRNEAAELLESLDSRAEAVEEEIVAEPVVLPFPRLAATEPQEAPEPAPAAVAVAAPARAPRRSFLDLCAAFMEQSNILWGELVGGLLIVVCSIALVISLWPKLEENPTYQFTIFVSVTAMLFGAGLYTFHHWKLEATSRGLLIIATLLVPLNFLAIVSQTRDGLGPLALGLEFGALALFSVLLLLTGRVLVPEGRGWFALATLGASASELLVPKVLGNVGTGSVGPLVLLGCLPGLCHLLGCGGGLRCALLARGPKIKGSDPLKPTRAKGSDPFIFGPLSAERAGNLFVLLGTSTFAVVTALGLLASWYVARGGILTTALADLSALVAVAALPLLAGGVLIRRFLVEEHPDLALAKVGDDDEERDGAAAAAAPVFRGGVLRTGATATALLGTFVMLASIVLAWPVPAAVVLVAALNVVVLSYVAFRHEMPFAHAAALGCAAVGYLTAFHLVAGNGTPFSLLAEENGLALVPLALLCAAASEGLFRFRKPVDARFYGIGSGVMALASLLLVTLPARGIDAPEKALAAYAIYGCGLLVANARWRRPLLTSIGLALLAAASLWGLWWSDLEQPLQRVPLWSAVLAAEALALGALGALTRQARVAEKGSGPVAWFRWLWHEVYQEPAARTAEGMALLAVIAAFWFGIMAWSWRPEYVVTGGCLFALFTLLAGAERRTGSARIAGLVLIGTAIATAGWLAEQRGTMGSGRWSIIALGVAIVAAYLAVAERIASAWLKGVRNADATMNLPWHAPFTAWRGPAAAAAGLALLMIAGILPFGEPARLTYVGALIAATTFILAWSYDHPFLSWTGSFLVLGTIEFEIARHLSLPVPWPHLAMLTHASLALAASLALRRLTVHESKTPEIPSRVRQLYQTPLAQSALLTSVLALSVLWQTGWATVLSSSWCLLWLAAVWLVAAVAERRPALFAAFQAVLGFAVVGFTTAWLGGQEWFVDHPWGSVGRLVDPWSLQAFGLALGLLAFAWMGVRIALRGHSGASRLLEPGWPGVDRATLVVLVLGQALLAVIAIAPAVAREFLAGLSFTYGGEVAAHAFGPGAWALLALVAVVLTAGLWDTLARGAVLGLVTLALTAAILSAGSINATAAAPVALRWALGGCLLVCSVPAWLRTQVTDLARRVHCTLGEGLPIAPVVRGMLVAGAVLAVLGMTVGLALLPFLGLKAQGPATGTFFAEVGRMVANAVPLALVAVALLGNALRERSSGYAFSSGLVVTLAVILGHALGFLGQHGPLDEALGAQLLVQVLQLVAITSAVWALGWVAVRSRWCPGTPAPALLNVQTGLFVVGNAVVLCVALGALVSSVPPLVPAWVSAAGSPLGWLALLVGVAVVETFCRAQAKPRQPMILGAIGMAVLGLFACSVAGLAPAWGYRALMLGWGAYPLLCLLLTWQLSLPGKRAGSAMPQGWLNAASSWVGVASLLTLLLGLNAAIVQRDCLWAAAAIALSCPAVAIVGGWRRNETWVFASSLGVNVAASLVVWANHDHLGLSEWYVTLVQANTIASAAAALLWLGMRSRIYDGHQRQEHGDPLLGAQVTIGIVGNLALLVTPAVLLFAFPADSFPAAVAHAGDFWGWPALLLAIVAAGWFGLTVDPRVRGSLSGAALLGAGVLLACQAGTGWFAYHLLMVAWAVAGFAALAEPRWLARLVAPTDDGPVQRSAARVWALAIGGLVVALALRGAWEDPARPYWSGSAAVAVCLLATLVAIQSRVPAQVFVSGLLANVVGFIAWAAWGGDAEGFFCIQTLCFSLAAAAWSWLGRTLDRPTDATPFILSWPAIVQPFTHLASLIGLCTISGLVAVVTVGRLTLLHAPSSRILASAALAATVVPFALRLHEKKPWLAREGLYLLGLTALALGLNGVRLSPHDYCWTAALALAPYVTLTALLAYAFKTSPSLRALLRLDATELKTGTGWFLSAQTCLAVVVVGLSVWMAFDGGFSLAGRLAGPLAVVILVVGFVLLASLASLSSEGREDSSAPRERPPLPIVPTTDLVLRYATLALGVLAAVETGWAFVEGTGRPASWLVLHQAVMLMTSLAVMTVLHGVVLARRLPAAWAECCRRSGPVLGALATMVLGVVMLQEALLYVGAAAGPSMALPAVVVVTLALIGLIVSAITFAVAPGRDPLGLSERGRALYVYAAEVMLVLIFVHLRFTEPAMFRQGLAAHYWPFILMAIAFLGALVSEFFERRGLRVLAKPLEHTGVCLPLLPMLAAWTVPAGNYAFVWFSAGLLYGMLSVRKGSFRLALVAALAVNAGLWVVLYHGGVNFIQHPQFWLIPMAVIVLVAEFYNRDRLLPSQSATLRYLGLIVIYVSSTADMFVAGVGETALYPLILALLSVFGILAGMVFRIRAFLLMGVAFLMLVLLTIIWHAGIDHGQTWILWSSGIALGVAILVLFGIFEKRRNDVLRVLDNVKRWK